MSLTCNQLDSAWLTLLNVTPNNQIKAKMQKKKIFSLGMSVLLEYLWDLFSVGQDEHSKVVMVVFHYTVHPCNT